MAHMTVRQNVAYGLKMKRGGVRQAVARRCAPRCDQAQRRGERYRPSYPAGSNSASRLHARGAQARYPSSEEPSFQSRPRTCAATCASRIRRLHDESNNSVYAHARSGEAMTMADRIVIMNAGRIEQIGTPQEVYERPNSAFCGHASSAAQRPRVTHVAETRSRSGPNARNRPGRIFRAGTHAVSICVKTTRSRSC